MVFTMSWAFDINSDRAAVRAILDSNGLFTTPIGDACYEGSSGRVEYLYHNGNGVWKTSKTYAKLTRIPAEIGNLTELTRFYVMNNCITSISDSIRNCKKLKWFDVSYNQLEILPELNYRSISIYAKNTFVIHHNLLKVLPDSICNLHQSMGYDTLRLNNNLLTSIPSSIGNIKSLVSLCADHNLLDSIPSSIGTLPVLQWLQVSYNNIKVLPTTIGDTGGVGFAVLADHNQISSIPEKMVTAPSHVYVLVLDYNYICNDNHSYSWLIQHSVYIDYQICTTIESQPSSPLELFSVYPNPFNGTTFIKTATPVNIYDISGRIVFQTSKSIMWNALPGVYILENNGNTSKVVSVR